MEDQRKRTLEALEQRFAQAKAEVQTQEQKSKKRPIEHKERVSSKIESTSANSRVKKPATDSSSRKGNFSFVGNTSTKDVDLNEPAYLKLSHSVGEKLLPSGVQVSDRKASVDKVLHELFQHGDSAQKYMQGSKSMKIDNTILLDNYVQKSGMLGRSQTLQNNSKRSKKHMSLKQHKKSGLFDLPKEFHKKDQLAQCFLNADLHGAIILVVESKVDSYVGVHGIMIRETKETFGIITEDNKFRVVPKKLSVFVVQAESWKVTLHGDKLASRNLVP